MKRLLIALGLFSIVGAAMGQLTDSSTVTFTVDPYRAVQLLTDPITAPVIDDGGFSGGPYFAPFDIQARGNTTWSLSGAFTVETFSAGFTAGGATWAFFTVNPVAGGNVAWATPYNDGGATDWVTRYGRVRLLRTVPGTQTYVPSGSTASALLTVTIGT